MTEYFQSGGWPAGVCKGCGWPRSIHGEQLQCRPPERHADLFRGADVQDDEAKHIHGEGMADGVQLAIEKMAHERYHPVEGEHQPEHGQYVRVWREDQRPHMRESTRKYLSNWREGETHWRELPKGPAHQIEAPFETEEQRACHICGVPSNMLTHGVYHCSWDHAPAECWQKPKAFTPKASEATDD